MAKVRVLLLAAAALVVLIPVTIGLAWVRSAAAPTATDSLGESASWNFH